MTDSFRKDPDGQMVITEVGNCTKPPDSPAPPAVEEPCAFCGEEAVARCDFCGDLMCGGCELMVPDDGTPICKDCSAIGERLEAEKKGRENP